MDRREIVLAFSIVVSLAVNVWLWDRYEVKLDLPFGSSASVGPVGVDAVDSY